MKVHRTKIIHCVTRKLPRVHVTIIAMVLATLLTGCGTVSELSDGYHAPILGAIAHPPAVRDSGVPVYVAVDDIATKSLTLDGLGDREPRLLTMPLLPHIKARTVAALYRQTPTVEFGVLASGETAPANSPTLTLSSISFTFNSSGAKYSTDSSYRKCLSKAATDISLTMSCTVILSDSSGNISKKSVKVESAQPVGGSPEKAVLSLLNDGLEKFANLVAVQAQGDALAGTSAGNRNPAHASDSKVRTDFFLKGYSVSHQEGVLSVLAMGGGLFMSGDSFAGDLAYSAQNSATPQNGLIPVSTDNFDLPLVASPLVGNWKVFRYSYSFPITTDRQFDEVVLVCITKKGAQPKAQTSQLAFLGSNVDETMKTGISSTRSPGWPASGGKCWLWFRPNCISGKLFIKKECVYKKEVTTMSDGSPITDISWDPRWFVSTAPFE